MYHIEFEHIHHAFLDLFFNNRVGLNFCHQKEGLIILVAGETDFISIT